MKRHIAVAVLARDDMVGAYIREYLSQNPVFITHGAFAMADAYIVNFQLLTPAGQKILQALADLGTITDVAEHLHYHRATIKCHLSRIYKKLRVKSAPQAVAMAMGLRLIG